MGQIIKFQCKKCTFKFEWNDGGGFSFDILHCDKCGKEKRIKTDTIVSKDGVKHLLKCKCGGVYLIDAPIRCPKCQEINNLDDGLIELMYD